MKKPVKKKIRVRAEKNIRIKNPVYERLHKIAWLERLTLSDAIDALVDKYEKCKCK